MKIFNLFVVVLLLFVYGECLAANSQSSTDNYKYATVDTAPGTDGYGTAEVNIRSVSDREDRKVWFSIRGTGTMTVTLQFKCTGETIWTDYESYIDNERKVVEGGSVGVRWRAIVKSGGHTSGSKTFGLDW